MKHSRIILFVTLLVVGMTSCKKDKDDSSAPKVTTGVYVLSEGQWQLNNSMLSYYNNTTGISSTDFFAKANGGVRLGDTGNDMMIYGSKLYIVMDVSGVVTVADARTGVKITNISFKLPDSTNREPRYISAYKNKVLVSTYDGKVSVIDTTSLAIEKDINIGSNLEQMAILGDKLYVVVSGALNTVSDSAVSIVNLTTMTEIQKIIVGYNPGYMTSDESGNLYISCGSNYSGTIKSRLVKVSTNTNTVVKVADTVVGRIKYFNGVLYAAANYYGVQTVRKLSTTDFSQLSPNFVTDGTKIVNPYNVNVDPENGDVYVTDAKDYKVSGEVFCFDKNGNKKFSFSTSPAINPSTVVFIK